MLLLLLLLLLGVLLQQAGWVVVVWVLTMSTRSGIASGVGHAWKAVKKDVTKKNESVGGVGAWRNEL